MDTQPIRARRAVNADASRRPPEGSQEGLRQTGESCLQSDPEAGAATAEYAILTLAAVAFAGVLALVVKSGAVQQLLQGVIERALGS